MDMKARFDFYNGEFFRNKLSMPEIRVESCRVALGSCINSIISIDDYAVKDEYAAIGKMILLHELIHYSIGAVHYGRMHGYRFRRVCRRIERANGWPKVSRKLYASWPFDSICRVDEQFKQRYTEYLGIKRQRDEQHYRRLLVDANKEGLCLINCYKNM